MNAERARREGAGAATPAAGSATPEAATPGAGSATPEGTTPGSGSTPEATTPDAERRDEVRVERFGWARYQSDETEGQGLVTNLSSTGARVERCSEPLDPGAKLVLRLKPAGGFKTVAVEAEVVRTTEDGFALRFNEASEDACRLLTEVIEAALAGA